MASNTRVDKQGSSVAPAIVWFRNDLRLDDHPALDAAVRSGAPIVALYALDDDSAGDWRMGAASRWWLHHSLQALAADLAKLGVALTLRRGRAEFVLEGLIAETGARAVYWNRLYEPWAMRRDGEIKTRLRASGLTVESFNGSLLFEPAHLRNKAGDHFKVFSPFWRACLAAGGPSAPAPAPRKLNAAPAPSSDKLADWRLLPTKPDWAGGLRDVWRVGEKAARARLADFLKTTVGDYKVARDFMAQEGVSHLSPHLHFGEVSPRAMWGCRSCASSDGASSAIISSSRRPTCRSSRSISVSRIFHGLATPKPLTPGRRGAPAIRWSTPPCANYG